jgi:hypothetical protein
MASIKGWMTESPIAATIAAAVATIILFFDIFDPAFVF